MSVLVSIFSASVQQAGSAGNKPFPSLTSHAATDGTIEPWRCAIITTNFHPCLLGDACPTAVVGGTAVRGTAARNAGNLLLLKDNFRGVRL